MSPGSALCACRAILFLHRSMTLYFLITGSNALLMRGDEVPAELPQGVTRPDAARVFDMTPKVGFSAEAWLLTADDEAVILASDAEAAKLASDGKTWRLVPLRETWPILPKLHYDAAARASAWVYWERTNRYCPICGAPLVRHLDMGKRCPQCGAEHFPHLAPAGIVLIVRPTEPYTVDAATLPLLQPAAGVRSFATEALLVHARNFRNPRRYGLVAGFLEGGESLEECVAREVHEEAGIDLADIRYFGSQPWPYPSGVMVGFTARCDASQQVRLDDGELSDGRFCRADNLPEIPDPMSIARQLIDAWLRGEMEA